MTLQLWCVPQLPASKIWVFTHCRIHPHHHGSSSLQTHTATVPVIIDVNTNGGFDPLGSASCANMRQFFPADNSNEIILHFQVSTCAPVLLPMNSFILIHSVSAFPEFTELLSPDFPEEP